MVNLTGTDEALAAQVVRETAEAIVVSDPDGVIRLWNQGAERVFGYTAAEALGRSLDLIIPERLRARHWEGYAKTMATGQTRYADALLKVPATHKDGRRMSIEFSVALLRSGSGGSGGGPGGPGGEDSPVTGIAAVIRDVTERWNEERTLRRRLAELESARADGSALGS